MRARCSRLGTKAQMKGKIPREGYTGQEARGRTSQPGSNEVGRLLRGEARAPGSPGKERRQEAGTYNYNSSPQKTVTDG